MLERFGRLSPLTQRVMLVLGCAVLFAVWLAPVPLIDIDETRYTEATRQMLTTGNFIIPEFNGEKRFAKPILYYWVQSASFALFGQHEIAARLPSALFGLGLVLLVHGWLLAWLPRLATDAEDRQRMRGAAFLGGVATAILPLVAIWTRAAVTDLVLTFFITGTLLALLQAELTRRLADDEAQARRGRWWYLPAAAGAGLAFLTKGPMGLAIPGLTWLIYHGRQRTLGGEWRRVPWLWALGIFTLVAAPWYVATYLIDGPGFLQQFFLAENVSRFAGEHGHTTPLLAVSYFTDLAAYFPTLLAITFPASAFLLRELAHPFSGQPLFLRHDALCAIRRFAWTWVGTVVTIFAFSHTRYPNYVQSIAAGVTILLALHVAARLAPGTATAAAPRWAKRLEVGTLIALALAWLAGMVFALLKGPALFRPWADPISQPHITLLIGLVSIITLGLGAVALRGGEGPRLIGGALACWAGLMAVFLLGIMPTLIRSTFLPAKEAGVAIRQMAVPAEEPLVSFMRKAPEPVIFYGQHEMQLYAPQNPESLPALRAQVLASGSAIVITGDPASGRKGGPTGLATLQQVFHVEELQRFRYFVIVRVTE